MSCLIFHVECEALCDVSYSMWNVKLYASWTSSMSNTVWSVTFIFGRRSFMRRAPSALCVMHHLKCLTLYVMHVSYSVSNLKLYASPSQCLTPYAMSYIPCRIWSFMFHAPSQCLTPYVMSHIPFGMRSFFRHAPSQCLTPNVKFPYSMYVELYASCTSSSMSDTICMSYLIFHGECEALCIMHHLNV